MKKVRLLVIEDFDAHYPNHAFSRALAIPPKTPFVNKKIQPTVGDFSAPCL